MPPRRRSAKKNIIRNNLIVEIERIISEDVSATEVLEANILLKSLTETHENLRNLDETIADALQTIEGLPLTNQNYTNAKDLLKARYGNPQLIISSHMKQNYGY